MKKNFAKNFEELMEGFFTEIRNEKCETTGFMMLYSIWKFYCKLGIDFFFDEILEEDEYFEYLWDRYYNPDEDYSTEWWMHQIA